MKRRHPSQDIRGSISRELEGKDIILAVTGSVAAQKSPELARWLMRRGADVYPVMSEAACRLIHPDLMEWACGNRPITRLSGSVEHVALAGNVPQPADLMAVYPATANTVGKASAAIDDTPVTTFITTALGEGIPLLLVPAMHQAMYQHPGVRENLEKLRRWGVQVMDPVVQEGKAKAPSPETVGARIQSILLSPQSAESPAKEAGQLPRKGPLWNRPVVITAGRTSAPIDPIRIITNRSSGRMGCALARAARRLGARVTLVAGSMDVPAPEGVTVVRAETAGEMQEALSRALSRPLDSSAESPDLLPPLCLAAAAVNDWEPVSPSDQKIPTGGRERLSLELKPTPKIADSLKDSHPEIYLVLFRALTGCSDEELRQNALGRLQQARGDMILANHAEEAIGSSRNRLEAILPDGSFRSFPEAPKEDLAQSILDYLAAILTNKDNAP